MHSHLEQQDLIEFIFLAISFQLNKPPQKIINAILLKKNKKFIRLFWEALEELLPNHPYQSLGVCCDCGSLQLL